jgi:hypothetical protein
MKIDFGGTRFKFKESFGEFTLTTIKEYMSIHDDTEKLIEDHNEILKKVQDITPSAKTQQDDVANLIDLDSQLSEIQFNLTGKRIDLLCILCNDASFRDFVENTDGVSYGVIKAALEHCLKKIGGFTDFWDSVPVIESFKVKMKGSLLRKKFKVHHFDKTSLYRETVASLQAQRALNHKTKLDSGSWDDICQFVAMIVRPSNELEEISFTRKAFIKGKKTKGLSHSDKLSLYIERFEAVWKKRAKTFKNLPLTIAVGVLKDFFQKKKS